MNDKQKQIEEMKNHINNAFDLYHKTGESDITKAIAEELIKYYQPKLPEGSIVQILKKVEFAGKEYDIQEMSMARSTYDAALNQARKQAVKEVLEKISNTPIKLTDLDAKTVGIMMATLIDRRNELAKEFGVEL